MGVSGRLGWRGRSIWNFNMGGIVSLFPILFAHLPLALLATDLVNFVDDTCTQPGYWSAISDFIASLGDAPS